MAQTFRYGKLLTDQLINHITLAALSCWPESTRQVLHHLAKCPCGDPVDRGKKNFDPDTLWPENKNSIIQTTVNNKSLNRLVFKQQSVWSVNVVGWPDLTRPDPTALPWGRVAGESTASSVLKLLLFDQQPSWRPLVLQPCSTSHAALKALKLTWQLWMGVRDSRLHLSMP